MPFEQQACEGAANLFSNLIKVHEGDIERGEHLRGTDSSVTRRLQKSFKVQWRSFLHFWLSEAAVLTGLEWKDGLHQGQRKKTLYIVQLAQDLIRLSCLIHNLQGELKKLGGDSSKRGGQGGIFSVSSQRW